MSERRVFVAAVLVVAVHAVVDALSPEPGAAISDHVFAGAVPLLILGAAIWSYPSLRPGLRATIAFALGSLALVGAAVSVAAAGLEGVDFSVLTGIAMAPAGLVLIALAGRLLWRSRRSDGHRYLRRALIAIGAVLLVFEVVVPIAVAIVATHRPAEAPAPQDLGRRYESVRLHTSDGLDLAGWWVPSENGAAVITFPDRGWTAEQSRMLAENGYGVLALDMRGYGESEGDPNAFGWGATADVDAAINFVASQPGVDPQGIGGLGLSVGGEQLLEAAAQNDGLRAVVSEGAGERSVRETLIYGPGAFLVLPASAVQTAAVATFSGDPPPVSLADAVAAIAPRAVFLIHAEHGAGGEELSADYYGRAHDPKQIWEVPGSNHTGGIDADRGEYERRVVAFFDRYLEADSASQQAGK